MNLDLILHQAVSAHQSGQLEQAQSLYLDILKHYPNHPDALYLLGLVHFQSNQLEQAVSLIQQAISIQPSPQMYCNLGVVLQAQGNFQDAIHQFHTAISMEPNYAEAFFNLGITFQVMHDLINAESAYQSAISCNPQYAAAFTNLGITLFEQDKFELAIHAYQKSLEISPNSIETLNNLGNAYLHSHQFSEADLQFKAALELNPDDCITLGNRAVMLQVKGDLDHAIQIYRILQESDASSADRHSNLIFAMDMHPGMNASTLQQERKKWAQQHANHLRQNIPFSNIPQPQRKLRIGYVSGYFFQQSAANVFGSMLMHFNRDQFEVYAYSNLNPNREDAVTRLFQQSVSQWRNVCHLSDDELASLIRDDAIDILVDLSSHMAFNRLLTFARKPAPIQIAAWGYIGGTGMQAMDYFFADNVLVPQEEMPLYAEQVICLPAAVNYFAFESFPPVNTLPALSGQGITFGSLNRLAKLTPETFQLWAQVLIHIPNSRIILKAPELDDASIQQQILERFDNAGIPQQRVSLIGKSSWAEHMATFNRIDISLDPFPHGGGVTALEGIMMGVPMVSLKWPTIIGRLSASILSALGLNDWIANDPQQYLSIALQKSSDLAALAVLRKQLRNQMLQSMIGNPVLYAGTVEKTYRQLWIQWCERGHIEEQGEPPQHAELKESFPLSMMSQ